MSGFKNLFEKCSNCQIKSAIVQCSDCDNAKLCLECDNIHRKYNPRHNKQLIRHSQIIDTFSPNIIKQPYSLNKSQLLQDQQTEFIQQPSQPKKSQKYFRNLNSPLDNYKSSQLSQDDIFSRNKRNTYSPLSTQFQTLQKLSDKKEKEELAYQKSQSLQFQQQQQQQQQYLDELSDKKYYQQQQDQQQQQILQSQSSQLNHSSSNPNIVLKSNYQINKMLVSESQQKNEFTTARFTPNVGGGGGSAINNNVLEDKRFEKLLEHQKFLEDNFNYNLNRMHGDILSLERDLQLEKEQKQYELLTQKSLYEEELNIMMQKYEQLKNKYEVLEDKYRAVQDDLNYKTKNQQKIIEQKQQMIQNLQIENEINLDQQIELIKADYIAEYELTIKELENKYGNKVVELNQIIDDKEKLFLDVKQQNEFILYKIQDVTQQRDQYKEQLDNIQSQIIQQSMINKKQEQSEAPERDSIKQKEELEKVKQENEVLKSKLVGQAKEKPKKKVPAKTGSASKASGNKK